MFGVELNGSAAVFGVDTAFDSYIFTLGDECASSNGLCSFGIGDKTYFSDWVPKEKNFLMPPNMLPSASLLVGTFV